MIYKVPDLTKQSTLQLAIDLQDKCPNDTFYFDFSDMTNFDPLAMLLSGAIIRSFRNKYPETRFVLKKIKDKGYAAHMGYFKYISPLVDFGKAPGEARGSNTYFPITMINSNDLMQEAAESGKYLDLEDLIESKARGLATVISQDNREIRILLTYLIREILRNTPEHTECETMWICGQYWPSYNLAEIAILDEGIGIYNSIIKNTAHAEYIHNNKDALSWAVRAGISEAFGPSRKPKQRDWWANSGYGLYTVSKICAYLGGSFCLISGTDYLTVDSKGQSYGKTFFNGTAIQIRVHTDKLVNAKQIISETVQQGEDEAKKIRNSFKKASTPSKGLREYLNIE